jgi:ABC-2 type transport system ATP-binding protein
MRGIDVLDVEGPIVLFEVRETGAEQGVIAEASRRGTVHEFCRVRPALSEVYREVTA